MKHSKGEWHVKNETDIYAGSELISSAYGFKVKRTGRYEVTEESIANAKLIAAAPEMLSLLIRYRNETPLGNQPHMISHEADEVIVKATQSQNNNT